MSWHPGRDRHGDGAGVTRSRRHGDSGAAADSLADSEQATVTAGVMDLPSASQVQVTMIRVGLRLRP
jgi:hypothetical protein